MFVKETSKQMSMCIVWLWMWFNGPSLMHNPKEQKPILGYPLLTFRCFTESNFMSQYEATFVLWYFQLSMICLREEILRNLM